MRSRFWIAVSLLLFLTLRVLALLTIPPLFDEMVQLYMARDIAELVRFPLYFYGQQYMGPFESYVLAPFIHWFGFSFLKGRIFNGIFYAVFMGTTCWTVRRVFHRDLALYVLTLLCIPPFTALFFTTVVGYGEILAFAGLALALLIQVVSSTRGARASTFLLGLISGLAFWCNPLFIVWLIPLGCVVLIGLPASWKKGLPFWCLGGFLAGLFPVWIHAFRTGNLMIIQGAGDRFAELKDIPSFLLLFLSRLRFFLSTHSFSFFSPPWRLFVLGTASLVLPLFVFCFGYLVFSFFNKNRVRTLPEKIFFLWMILPSLLLVLFYICRDLKDDEGMRYFLPLLVPFAFSLSWWLHSLASSFWRRMIFFSLVGVLLLDSGISFQAQNVSSSELRRILRFLEERQLHYGVAVNDPAYALNALSREAVAVTPMFFNARYKPVWEAVKKGKPKFYILGVGDPLFREKVESDPALTKVSFVRYDVFYGSSPLLEKILEAKSPDERLTEA